MKVGFRSGSPEAEIAKRWLAERYHAPSDDLNQPVDLTAAAEFEEVIRSLTLKIANDPKRPEWKSSSFFRRFAAKQRPTAQQ
jgi:hypothetical protein